MTKSILCAAALGTAVLTSCVHSRQVPFEGDATSRVLRTGPSQSMVYVASTSAGPIVIDLGWIGAQKALRTALAELGAEPTQVAAVFVTHAHRDHIEAWPLVAKAPFYLGAPERDFLFGEFQYRAWVPRTADAVKPPDLPPSGALEVHEFTRDTTIVIGADTVRAFLVTGHTPGSVAYVFRNILFAGDALMHSKRGGFRPARARYSDDPEQAERSLRSLLDRVAPLGIRYVCTAHASCTDFGLEFVQDVLGTPISQQSNQPKK